MSEKQTIVQIIPAVGWWAAYKPDDENEPLAFDALVCWALIEMDEGEQGIAGVDAEGCKSGFDLVDEVTNFAGYYTTEQKERYTPPPQRGADGLTQLERFERKEAEAAASEQGNT